MVRLHKLSQTPFGVRLGDVLKHVGLSREEVAASVGVSKDSVNNWCSRRTLIDLQHLSRLALALREAGAPRHLLHLLLAEELARHGMAEEAVRPLDRPGQWMEDRPVVVLSSQFVSGSFQLMGLGLHDALKNKGVEQVVYLDTCGRSDVLSYYLAVTLQSPIRGVVLVGLPQDDHEQSELALRLTSRGIPCVFVYQGPAAPPPGSALVRVDTHGAAALAVEFLWSRGHRRTIAIAVARGLAQREKMEGYCAAVKRLGGVARVVWAMAPGSGLRPAAQADRPDLRDAAELVAADPEVSAIVALSSHAAAWVIRALHDRGRMLGSDASVIALGCWEWMHEVAFPPLTHVALPFYEAGQQAGQLILSMADRELPPWGREVIVSPPTTALHGSHKGTVATLA